MTMLTDIALCTQVSQSHASILKIWYKQYNILNITRHKGLIIISILH